MAAYPATPIALMLAEELPDYQVLATGMELGYVQTRAKTTVAPRRLTIAHHTLTVAQVATWEAFWNARKGGGESFTFTHPRTSAGLTVRFRADSQPTITLKDGSANLYDIEGIELEEAL
jgi:hypothetical protein